jgi:hypothetical protein
MNETGRLNGALFHYWHSNTATRPKPEGFFIVYLTWTGVNFNPYAESWERFLCGKFHTAKKGQGNRDKKRVTIPLSIRGILERMYAAGSCCGLDIPCSALPEAVCRYRNNLLQDKKELLP